MSKLILTRHGQSTWNAENRFTGWVDVGLSEKGKEEAEKSGKLISELNIKIDINKLSNYEFFKHQYRSFLLMMYVFEVTEWTGKIISKEGELLRWVSAKDLKKAKLLPANTKVVNYFLK